MTYRMFFLLPLLLVGGSALAQSGPYLQQEGLIREMMREGNYRVARVQAAALVESGEQARLPAVEGRARYLLGLILTENPAATARDRVAGIRELRLAATLLRNSGAAATVDSVLTVLEQLTGSKNTEITSLPSVKAFEARSQQDLPSAAELDAATLNAIVSLQDQAITALNDSQLRQLITLERQERELDAYAYQTLDDSLQLFQQRQQLAAREAEVRLERQRRNMLLALAAAVAILLALVYSRYRSSQRYQARLEAQNAVITAERQRSEELLLNILPVTVAAELKATGKATARRFDSATVLFADFKGFSTLAATLPPERLIFLLDEAFRAFDEIIERYGLEKIKTIGDAYMCAGGLPEEDRTHAERAVRAALDMQGYLSQNPHFSARIGIHTGPVVAGVVGKHKFVYDIWGDTVNQASRLEVAGETGRVAISRSVCDRLPDGFVCTPAGTFQAKNIGEMERFFVTLPA